ncbi:ABC transporter ATP-binding protein [Guggenheimella bovis]
MNLFDSTAGLYAIDHIVYPKITIEDVPMTFLTGPSGSGKSTYLRLLNRTLLPKAGTILYRGEEISKFPVLDYRKEVLLVPQEVFLLEDSIEENFRFYYSARGDALPSKEIMEHFLALSKLDQPLTADCKVLSGGEKQRVFLAIFLSLKPKVLLFDEPTAALDEKTSFELFTMLKESLMESKTSAVVVSHNESLKEHFADRSIQLGGGRGA